MQLTMRRFLWDPPRVPHTFGRSLTLPYFAHCAKEMCRTRVDILSYAVQSCLDPRNGEQACIRCLGVVLVENVDGYAISSACTEIQMTPWLFGHRLLYTPMPLRQLIISRLLAALQHVHLPGCVPSHRFIALIKVRTVCLLLRCVATEVSRYVQFCLIIVFDSTSQSPSSPRQFCQSAVIVGREVKKIECLT